MQRLLSDRILAALLPAAGGFLRTVGRAARQLLHEITGALFAVFVVIGGVSTWQAWRQASPGGVVGVSLGFTVMMACFSAASFWRGHKVGRS